MTRAREIHEAALVLDAHTDTLQRVVMDGVDLAERSAGDPLVERADLPRYRDGSVNAQIFAAWVDTIYLPDHAARRTLRQIDAFHQMIDDNPESVGLARTAGDVRRLAESGRFAALLSIEGGDSIHDDLGMLRIYHRLGACSMTLCHSRSTDWVDSATDVPKWNGLNDFGRDVVREMNELGMMVDVSHVSDQAVLDVVAASNAPVIASHSCCRALCDHARNLTDELLAAVAGSGGVIGINFYSGFLDQAYLDELNQTKTADVFALLNAPPDIPTEELDDVARERLYSLTRDDLPRPPFSVILDHIDHAVAVVGVDHVGIGTDLDVPHLSTPVAFDDVSHFPRVTEGLVGRGYTETDIRKILGENWLRVLGVVTGV